ncbi:MAG: ROK family protein [Micropruina sp.]
MRQFLTLDIGGSAIKYALMDEEFRLIEQGSRQGAPASQADFIEAIGQLYDTYADRIEGVAISSCGELDPVTGYFYGGGTLAYNRESPVKDLLAARIPAPISIENDANCALLAEVRTGALQGSKDALMVVIGSGLGGALLINGHVHRGSKFYAGSLSFMYGDVSGPRGLPYALGWSSGVGGLLAPYAMSLPTDGPLNGPNKPAVDGKMFFAELAAGNPVAQNAFDDYCSRLAMMIYNVQCLLDLDAVAIGGGISAQPIVVETIRAKLAALYPLVFLPIPQADVRVCQHRNDANLIGALVHYLDPEV